MKINSYNFSNSLLQNNIKKKKKEKEKNNLKMIHDKTTWWVGY
jgi:hypothetical protein